MGKRDTFNTHRLCKAEQQIYVGIQRVYKRERMSVEERR